MASTDEAPTARDKPIELAMGELAGTAGGKEAAGPDMSDPERAAVIGRGLRRLRALTGADFGFDLEAWHRFLSSDEVGARLGYERSQESERRVREAAGDPQWERVVDKLLTDSVV